MDGKFYSLGSPNQFPVDEDILKYERGTNRSNGKVMALQSKERISNDKRITQGNENADGHRDPKRNLPPDHCQSYCIGSDPNILSFSQLNLTSITPNGIPSHPEKGEKEELDRHSLDKGSCPEPGKDEKEEAENGKANLFWF
jgi:hypothetical protein